MRKLTRSTSRSPRSERPSGNSQERPGLQVKSPESPGGESPPLSVLPALREVLVRMTAMRSTVITVSLALKSQKVEHNPEIAQTLQRCVGDEMDRMVWRLRQILGDAE